jgi:hypothetical protein
MFQLRKLNEVVLSRMLEMEFQEDNRKGKILL